MKYQLIVQWPASSISDYDAMVEIEDVLIDKLDPKSEVDGHDAGSGEMNIFIGTDDPKKTFDEVRTLLQDQEMWSEIRIAYRETLKSDYTVLWPPHLKDFRVT